MAIAQYLDGFVRRKVIKQTVMTTVYGVTRFGARLQIAKQLKGILINIVFLKVSTTGPLFLFYVNFLKKKIFDLNTNKS